MAELILDERLWCEDIVSNPRMGNNVGQTLTLLARYYHEAGYKKQEIRRRLEWFVLRCRPNSSLQIWTERIESALRQAGKGELVQIDYIGITQNELDIIAAYPTKLGQRLLFTMLCIAKYTHTRCPSKEFWVNVEQREVFSRANITMNVHRQNLLLGSLIHSGHLGMSCIVDNGNMYVNFVDTDGEPAVKVRDMRNLGNQYLRLTEQGYFECQCCGLVVRRRSPGNKYCADCASDMKVMKTIEARMAKQTF